MPVEFSTWTLAPPDRILIGVFSIQIPYSSCCTVHENREPLVHAVVAVVHKDGDPLVFAVHDVVAVVHKDGDPLVFAVQYLI